MGLTDLMAWINASEAASNAQTANEKIDAIDKKIDIIAQELHELLLDLEANGTIKKT